MAHFYFDESIHERGGFIAGAYVYGPDANANVLAAVRRVGLRAGVDEFKSSTMAASAACSSSRLRLHVERSARLHRSHPTEVPMRLIGLAIVLAVGLTLAPHAAEGQQAGQVPRVGYLSPGSFSDPARLRRFEAFRQGLRELGYVEGQNIAIESRWAEGKYEQYPALTADLIHSKVDVIVVVGGAATRAAQQATRTIPIVMSIVIDPVGSGLVASLARPGGNVTGITMMAPDLVGKQLELLKEAIPRLSRVALLWNPDNPGSAPQLVQAEAAARALAVRLQALEARNPQEIDSAFAAMTRERAGAFLILADAILGLNQRKQIADLAARARLPAVYGVTEYAEVGGLMVYGANLLDLERRAATYVHKILHGAKPADLPVEQPTKFELVINRASRES